ncbi:DUF7504 family protein [Halorussus litoreus]|uniref:DUF7504 family protein n=1 Tax=Halorussus litoreus TaxID=1710536 RepID=UPI000E275C8B|nr:hypothetical protein [Halorussus litoreus]
MTAGETGSRDESGRAFASRLASLKKRGSAVLVVGNLRSETYRSACTRMLGEESAGPRRRLLVATGEGPHLESGLPADANPPSEHTTLVSGTTEARSTAVETGGTVASADDLLGTTDRTHATADSPEDGVERVRVDTSELGDLGVAVSKAIADFETEVGGLDPAQLRFCFDSLRPLLAEHDEREVFQFLDLLTERVRSVDGMGHFHLPVARDTATVRTFAPLFDVVVHLQKRDGRLQQRWELEESGLSSGWIPI